MIVQKYLSRLQKILTRDPEVFPQYDGFGAMAHPLLPRASCATGAKHVVLSLKARRPQPNLSMWQLLPQKQPKRSLPAAVVLDCCLWHGSGCEPKSPRKPPAPPCVQQQRALLHTGTSSAVHTKPCSTTQSDPSCSQRRFSEDLMGSLSCTVHFLSVVDDVLLPNLGHTVDAVLEACDKIPCLSVCPSPEVSEPHTHNA